MKSKLFNDLSLSNKEIERILKEFEDEIRLAIRKTIGRNDEDCEQNIKLALFKTLSKNRKK